MRMQIIFLVAKEQRVNGKLSENRRQINITQGLKTLKERKGKVLRMTIQGRIY